MILIFLPWNLYLTFLRTQMESEYNSLSINEVLLFEQHYKNEYMQTVKIQTSLRIYTLSRLRLKHFCNKVYRNPNFTVTVYRFRKIEGKSNFSEQFRKLINRYKRIGYSLDIMRQTACLVVNPIIVDCYASLFNCTTVRASDSMTASS